MAVSRGWCISKIAWTELALWLSSSVQKLGGVGWREGGVEGRRLWPQACSGLFYGGGHPIEKFHWKTTVGGEVRGINQGVGPGRPFVSAHATAPINYRRSQVTTIFNQMRKICTTDTSQLQLETLTHTLVSNGYVVDFIIHHNQPPSPIVT